MTTNRDDVIGVLKTIFDPEVPVNIWDMGLVYDIDITDARVRITMTFTSPTCPMMDDIVAQVKTAVTGVTGLDTEIELVWEPKWDLSRMSDAARLELDLTEQGW